ncbi:MAG: threonine/serine exporter family protein [Bacteroidaceae bacterium]|nr:threonine/serine exporter family protein [Bacteroidaceae bacterium]
MDKKERFTAVAKFLGKYASHQMGCGVHTSRVVRNTKRLSESFDIDVAVSLFQRTLTISVYDHEANRVHSELVEIQHQPILFIHNASLSALSWEALDNHLTLDEVKKKYDEALAAPLLHPLFILILASLANLSFCKLFGGDIVAMIIVFVATASGFYLKQCMTRWHCNNHLTFIASAFTASFIAASSFFLDTTSEIAMATSVLFLIPGVPLVNGVIDIIEGYTLIGVTRLINCALMILCIAVGLGGTLMIFQNSLF